MTKGELIKKIALEFSVDETDVLKYFDSMFETIASAFRKNKNVNISEFGKFILRKKTSEDGIKYKNISFSPARKFALDVNYNFSELIPFKVRTLTEKELREKEFDAENDDEVILIESDGEIVENEISDSNENIFENLTGILRKSFLEKEAEPEPIFRTEKWEKEEEISSVDVVKIDEDRDALEAAITDYVAKNKIKEEREPDKLPEEVSNDDIIPEEIASDKHVEAETAKDEEIKEEETIQLDKSMSDDSEEEFVTFTKQREPSYKPQNIFPESDRLLIELQNLKDSFEKDKPDEQEPDISELKQKQDIFDLEDEFLNVPGSETEQKAEQTDTTDEKKLEKDLQKMLEEREKILEEIKRLERNSHQIKEIDDLLNRVSEKSGDLLDVNKKPVINEDKNITEEKNIKPDNLFGDKYDNKHESSGITEDSDFQKSFDISDLEFPGLIYKSETDVDKKGIDNPEMQIFDKLNEESLPEEKYSGKLDSLKEQFESLSGGLTYENKMRPDEKDIDKIFPGKTEEEEMESFDDKLKKLKRFYEPE